MTRRLFDFPWRSPRRIDADVDRELEFHIQSRTQALIAEGLPADDAAARARGEFGDLEDARRYMARIDREIEHAHRRREHVHDLWQDVRYAMRRMRASPVFAVSAIATLALGIGANTAVFSVVEAALLRPLPYPNADRVVSTYTLAPFGPFSTSPPDFVDWRAQTTSFSAMAAISAFPRTLTGAGEPRSVPSARVTAAFFQVLGVTPMLGRGFTPEEMEYGDVRYAILSHAMWQQSFGARPDVVGTSIDLSGAPYRIVGVMPRGFAYPGRTQIWTPLAFSPNDLATQRGAHYLDVIALLRPGVDAAAAAQNLKQVAGRLATQYPNTNKDYSASLEPLRESLVGSTPRRALLVLLGAVALVALIACANVANLVLARGTAREREMAVRLALGASPRDLVYMAMTESVLLAVLGGVAGLLLARGLAGALDALRPEGLREIGELRIQFTAAAFTFALSVVAGMLFGMAPAMQASRRRNLQPALQSGGRADAGDVGSGRLRSTLMAAEIALAVVLLSGASLLIKSFTRLQHVDAGFDARNLLVFSLSLPDARYKTSDRVALAYREIVDRATVLPGAASVGAMSMLPLDGDRYSISTGSIDGQRIPPTEQPSTQIRIVTANALQTLGIRLRSGRWFQSSDRMGAAPVVLVNESAARLLFRDVNPIGHQLTIGTRFTEDTTRAGGTVVGVVADVRDRSLGSKPSPTIYFPHEQAPWSDMNVIVRGTPGLTAASLVPAITREVHALDPLLPVTDPRSMDDVVSVSVAQPRFATLLMSVFAGLALVLALIGVFGVMAYIVGQRTREIGIRMALGASGGRVIRESLLRAAAPLVAGAVVGLAVTLALAQVLSRLLYDVTPRDPSILAGVTVMLVAVALVAAWIPARRASTVDPLIAVRND